jgi:hypothetical protein
MQCVVMQKVFTVEMYMRKKNYKKCHSKFRSQFPDSLFLSELTVYGLVNKFQTADFLLRCRSKHNLFFSEETLSESSMSSGECPQKFLG